MRVTSELFVSALMRRVFADGGFAAVQRRGAGEAGAIFVLTRSRTGAVSLLGPAPQASYDTGRPAERSFAWIARDADEAAVAERLARELRFDSDLWVVEIEPARLSVEELLSVTTP